MNFEENNMTFYMKTDPFKNIVEFDINSLRSYIVKEPCVIELETKILYDAIRNIKKEESIKLRLKNDNTLILHNERTDLTKTMEVKEIEFFAEGNIPTSQNKIKIERKAFDNVCKEAKTSKSEVIIEAGKKFIKFSTKPLQGCKTEKTFGKFDDVSISISMTCNNFFSLGKLFKPTGVVSVSTPSNEMIVFSSEIGNIAMNTLIIFASKETEQEDKE